MSNVASFILGLRSYNIEEGSVDRCKRLLQSESATVTHEGIVVINIVIVGVIVADRFLRISFLRFMDRIRTDPKRPSVLILSMRFFSKINYLGIPVRKFFSREETIS